MAKSPTRKKPDGWHHVATRLADAEMRALEAYRDRHGLTSLNGAVRHWLKQEGSEFQKEFEATRAEIRRGVRPPGKRLKL